MTLGSALEYVICGEHLACNDGVSSIVVPTHGTWYVGVLGQIKMLGSRRPGDSVTRLHRRVSAIRSLPGTI